MTDKQQVKAWAERRKKIATLAQQIHKRNGHPKHYNGPCWGPTIEECKEAERIVDSQ